MVTIWLHWLMVAMMILEDCILLARTVPEKSKKYGIKTCGIIYSPETMGLHRIYPLDPRDSTIRQRDIFQATLERNPLDSRRESQKIVKIKAMGGKVDKFTLRPILEKLSCQTLDILQASKSSVGVLMSPANTSHIEMKRKADVEDPRQLPLFKNHGLKRFNIREDYPLLPVVVIPSKNHQVNFPLREWGVFVLMSKKNGIVSRNYIQGLFQDKDIFYIIGNMNSARNTWLVCGYQHYKQNPQMDLF